MSLFQDRVGIILAGGYGTRLYPVTKIISKHLLPVYDKPMVYFPLNTLIELGHKEIFLVTNPEYIESYKKIILDLNLNININFETQLKPTGIPDVFNILKKYVLNKKTTLILGDNIFFSNFSYFKVPNSGATITLTEVENSNSYGVVELKENKIISLEEKPLKPKSNLIATGLYFFDEKITNAISNLKPSKRGELEIIDVMKYYLLENNLHYNILKNNDIWFDVGSYESLYNCSKYIKHQLDK